MTLRSRVTEKPVVERTQEEPSSGRNEGSS